jgi:hypothetical protein
MPNNLAFRDIPLRLTSMNVQEGRWNLQVFLCTTSGKPEMLDLPESDCRGRRDNDWLRSSAQKEVCCEQLHDSLSYRSRNPS